MMNTADNTTAATTNNNNSPLKYLQEYQETLESLPQELQRSYTLMRELDIESQLLQKEIETIALEMVKPKAVSKSIPTDVATDVASTDVATDAATDADATIAVTNDAATGAKAKNLLEKLEVLCRHGQEKWVLATQTYDMVDKHCRRLDEDLQRFDEQMGLWSTNSSYPVKTASSVTGTVAAVATVNAASNNMVQAAGTSFAGNPTTTATMTTTTSTKKRKKEATSSNINATTKGGGGGKRQLSSNVSSGANKIKKTQQDIISSSKERAQKYALESELPPNPEEPTYCICGEVSYGEMVACDNKDCEIEWFHYPCVGLVHKPKGNWYCPTCRKSRQSGTNKVEAK